jgi:hypothetical protein
MKKTILSAIVLTLAASTAFAQLPNSFQVKNGKIKIELLKRSFWNMNGIWYDNIEICRKGTAWYGTVIATKTGFVGSGHMENKIGEKDVQVEFFLDGKPWTPVAGVTECSRFEMKKKSLLMVLLTKYTLKLENEGITERVSIKNTASKNYYVSVLYNFMHPWHSRFTDYSITGHSGTVRSGIFSNTKREEFKGKFPQKASCSSSSDNIAFTSLLTSEPELGKQDFWFVWNRKSDRKLYYGVSGKSFEPGREYVWNMTTSFAKKTRSVQKLMRN